MNLLASLIVWRFFNKKPRITTPVGRP